MSPPPLLTLTDIHLTFGSTPLLEGADLKVMPRDRLCLVGRNGSGKSTLLKIAAGHVEQDSGERFLKPGTTLRYLPQEPDLTAYATIADYVEAGLEGADQAYRVPYLLDALGIEGHNVTTHLSGGEARRAALARTLAPEPDILLLDEPTNHLDLPVIEWLEDELTPMSTALILISHDRRFLEKLSKNTVWIDRGKTHLIEKNFSYFEDWRDEFFEHETRERHKLDRKIHREQHWVVHGVSGRRKRNVRRLKDLAGLRQQVKDQRQQSGAVSFTTTEATKSGKSVAKLESVSKSFGERMIIDDFSIKISRGERIGIVGPNGSGKTTLLKLIMGDMTPDSGSIELGVNLQPLVIDQKRETLNPEWSLSEALTDGGGDKVIVGDKSLHVIRYMKDFLFAPEQARTSIQALSGGERGRLQLARGLRLPSNFLVLDEPTNDLDLETLDLLQEVVADYPGTVIVVSHDRDFLDRTVTRIIGYEGKAKWQIYAGGYQDMVNQRGFGVKARASDNKQSDSSSPDKTRPLGSKKSSAKLSYKHKHRLEKLPAEISACETKITALETKLSDPTFFSNNPTEFNEVIAALEQEKASLESYESEWLDLEMLKESLE